MTAPLPLHRVNSRRLGAFAGVFLAAGSAADAQQLTYQSTAIYDHTSTSLTVNGYPLNTISATGQPLVTTDLTSYLLQGVNEISWKFTGQPELNVPAQVRFRLEKKTQDAATLTEQFTIERLVERVEQGDAPNVVVYFQEGISVKPADGFRHELRSRILPGLASRSLIDLTAQESRLASLPADPGEMTVHFNLNDTPLATLPWIGAAVVLTPEDQTAITDLVLAMQAAFVARDTTALADLQNLRIGRFATARGQTVAQFRSDLIDSYQPLFADPAFVFEPFDAAALTLVSQPGVNLVQVLRDGSPPIKATGQTGGLSATFKVPVFVSKIAGIWKIVD